MLTHTPLETELAGLLTDTHSPHAGALTVFGGTVRLDDGVQAITYTAYEAMAQAVLDDITAQTLALDGVCSCKMVHRLGTVTLGELSVLVVIRAAHRDQAFTAARFAIDTLKARTPIWKEEALTESTRFVEGQSLVA